MKLFVYSQTATVQGTGGRASAEFNEKNSKHGSYVSEICALVTLYQQTIYGAVGLEYGIVSHSSHYNDVIMSTMVSQITSLTIVYSTVYLGADQRKHQSSSSLAIERGIHRWPVNSPHKWPVKRKMFPFDEITMYLRTRKSYCIA